MNDAALPPAEALRIARAFLPERWWGNRTLYYYSRAKLREVCWSAAYFSVFAGEM